MKALYKYLGITLIGVLSFASCSEQVNDENKIFEDALTLKKKAIVTTAVSSAPVSFEGITPQIIPGENKGGNRTCEEVAAEFNTTFAFSSGKNDYDGANFSGGFPSGLTVDVTDGVYVSFSFDGDCLEIGGKYYKVGAVIVKGSNQANVYFYPDGITSDSGLASPLNSSGNPAGLSNLTFCFIDCEEEDDKLFTVKLFLRKTVWAAIKAPDQYYDEGSWCDYLGVVELGNDQTFDLEYYGSKVGTINIVVDDTNINSVISFDDPEESIRDAYIYYGTKDSLDTFGSCPDYTSFYHLSFGVSDDPEFTIPLN